MSATTKQAIILLAYILTISTCDCILFARENVCLTRTCVVEAAKLLRFLDQSVSPCDNFHGFVCGNWMRSTVLPDNKQAISQYLVVNKYIDQQLKGLIDSIDVKTEKREFVRNVKNYYESCHNTTLLELWGDQPLWELLDRLGGWPLISEGQWDELKWDDLYLRLRNEGFDSMSLFNIKLAHDPRNKTRPILALRRPNFGLIGASNLLKGHNDPIVKAYKNLIFNVINKLMFAVTNHYQPIRTQVNSLLAFDINLAEKLNETRNTQEEKILTVNRLTELTPNIDWLKLLRGFVSKDIRLHDEILTSDLNYIKFLNEILPKYSNFFLANHMIWRVVEGVLGLLDENWLKIQNEFLVKKTGIKVNKAGMCNDEPHLTMALSHLHVNKYFDNCKRKQALNIVENVVNQFRHSLSESQWLSALTRQKSIDKLDKMKLLVGYPDELMAENFVAEYYKKLELSSIDFFGNRLRLNKWFTDSLFDRIREPIDLKNGRELSKVAMSRALYNKQLNVLMIMAGMLQGVFFNKHRPNYLNYGAIGAMAGHEIIHGFSGERRLYDSNGQMNNWWDNQTNEHYDEKTKCFVEQYSNETVEEIGQIEWQSNPR